MYQGKRTPITLPPMKKEPKWWPIIVSACLLIWPLTFVLLIRKVLYTYKQKKYADYRDYAAVIGSSTSIKLEEIASVTGRTLPAVRYDIQAMLDKGLLGNEAYIDKRTMTLRFQSEQTEAEAEPPKHVIIEKNRQQGASERSRSATDTKPKAASGTTEPVNASAGSLNLSDFESILNKIRTLNDQIDDAVVSEKIDRIGVLTAGIFAIVQMKPERSSEVNKFMNYYLPTTFKLLETYALMEKQGYQSAAITESRNKIEAMLDQLIKAFEKQQDIMFKSEVSDVDVDIRVLEAMMAKDGLVLPRGADINDYRVREAGR